MLILKRNTERITGELERLYRYKLCLELFVISNDGIYEKLQSPAIYQNDQR